MSQLSNAIETLVIKERTELLKRIANDFNLDFADLESNYLAPKKAVSVKSVKVVASGKQCCTALTSKKEACKFSALKGEVFCKRHMKKEGGDSKPAPPKVAGPPVHTHELGTAVVPGTCDLCESHGNPVEAEESEFEIVDRMSALLEDYEEDEE